MQTLPRPDDQAISPRHLILFDGGCGFCRRAVLSVAQSDPAGAFQFASLDSDLGRKLLAQRGINPSGAGTMFVLPDWQRSSQPELDRAAGTLFIARRLAWPWKSLAALGMLPQQFLDRCYDAVARNRHRLASSTTACSIPDATVQDRFLP